MAFAVDVKASNDSAVMQVLSRISLSDPSKLFDEIGSEISESTRDRFINQEDVSGNPWKQSWRASLQGGKTLRDRGLLMNSITHNVLANGLEVGTGLGYAHVLHFGAVIRPKTSEFLIFKVGDGFRKVKQVTIPERTFLGINADDERSILDVIEEHLIG